MEILKYLIFANLTWSYWFFL